MTAEDIARSQLPYNGYKTIIDFVRQCIADNQLVAFYLCRPWKRLRAAVLASDKYECQICKGKGKYTRADHVHHVRFVRDIPDLAMSKHYIDEAGVQRRQLISVCKLCHETECHPNRGGEPPPAPLTAERWD